MNNITPRKLYSRLQNLFHNLFNSLKRSPGKGRRYRIIKILIVVFGIFLAANLFFIFLVYQGFYGKLPEENELAGIKHPLASEVYSADSVLMGRYFIQNRLDIEKDELTPVIRNSLISTEDVRFYEHGGVDFRSLLRVLFKTILLSRDNSGGGSTITQQLAKNLYPRQEHGLLTMPVNKVREMMIAIRLEKIYSKEELLELYLNTVPFGEDTYGIKTASRLFFGKSPAELKIEEAALLVGMLKGTHYYNPRIYPARSLRRRNIVLHQLEHYGKISSAEADSLSALPLNLNYSALPYFAGIAPYFREYLRQELDKLLSGIKGEDGESVNLYTDGLKIYTSIDSRMQKYAVEAVNEHLGYLQKIFEGQWDHRDIWKSMNSGGQEYLLEHAGAEGREDSLRRPMEVFSWMGDTVLRLNSIDSVKYFMNFLQSGFLALDARNAEVKAWVGGIDFKYFKYDHVLAARQTGSVFKPLVYMTAIQQDIAPCDYYPNDSIVYREYENWSPRNADRKYGGEYSVRGGLANSVNTITAALIMETGTESVINTARKVGIRSEIPVVPSIALGTANLSLFEILRFYSSLASGGIRNEPVYLKEILDRNGKTIYHTPNNQGGQRVFTDLETEMMTSMLKHVVDNGTASGLQYKYHLYNDIAGKTGTSQNNSDGWFVGYTPSLVAGVWVGGELPGIRFRSMRYGQGSFSAMPVFAKFLQKLYKDPEFSDLSSEQFAISDEVKEMMDCEDYREKQTLQDIIKESLFDKIRKWRLFRRDRR